MTVLIVEDVRPMREAIRLVVEQALARLGTRGRIELAGNLAETELGMMRHRPDVVLLDVTLGLESGLSMLGAFLEVGARVWILATDPWPGGRPLPSGVEGVWLKPRNGHPGLESMIQLLQVRSGR